MHGLQVIDVNEPGLLDRLLRRRPRENAFIEINNIVASVPFYEITRECIEERLAAYEISPREAKPRLLSMFAHVLQNAIYDWTVSEEEAAVLTHLRMLFDLSAADLGHLYASIVYPFYEQATVRVLADRRLTGREAEYLSAMEQRLGIPPHIAREIYGRHAHEAYGQTVAAAVADRRLSAAEDAELARLARELNVAVRPDAQTQTTLDRFRYLWKLSQGDTPPLSVPVHLPPGEKCVAYVSAAYSEVRVDVTAIRYSGYTSSGRAPGVRFQSGSVWTQRVAGQNWHALGEGMLYFTTRCLLFYGERRTTEVSLSEVTVATFYADGLLVETDAGTAQAFHFAADMEVLQALFDGLMTTNTIRSSP